MPTRWQKPEETVKAPVDGSCDCEGACEVCRDAINNNTYL